MFVARLEAEQGELQGGLASMSSLTAIISPPFMTQLFATFTSANAPIYFAGAPWLAAALHVLLGLVAVAWIGVRSARGRFGPGYFGPVDYVGLYWHLVDMIWIYLFPLLYLIH